MKILIVDDDRLYRIEIERIIAKRGHQVAHATNGADALSVIRTDGPFDAIITDMQMELMTGLELIQAFRSIHKEVPCLLHSSEEHANVPEVGYIKLEEIGEIFSFVEFHSKFERGYIQGFIDKVTAQ